MSKERWDAVVIGGGIAGLAAAERLGAGGLRACVVEREPVVFTHASGHNAAIFRAACASPADVRLALRSAALLDELLGGRAAWLSGTGALYVAAEEEPIEALRAAAAAEGLLVERVGERFVAERAPAAAAFAGSALWAPGDGVLDGHAISRMLERRIREAEGRVRTGAAVERIAVAGGSVEGVELAGGELIEAGRVVIASGAWAAEVGGGCGAGLPLSPMRRHVSVLQERLPARGPVVWRVDDEVYFRPESGGALASPCDEEPWRPESPPASPAALELLARKLQGLSPLLAGAAVRRHWACLRTFAPDRRPAVGADPRVRGLYWIAGLGGHGMTGGLAAGEGLADAVLGRATRFGGELAPGRLLVPRRSNDGPSA